MTTLKILVLMALVSVAVALSLQNLQPVTVEILIWSKNLPISVLITSVFGLGVLTGCVLWSLWRTVRRPRKWC